MAESAFVRAHLVEGRFDATVHTQKHEFVADIPKEKGGTDIGMTPGEILHSSLAACTVITLRLYANRKGWPLTDVEAKVRDVTEEVEDYNSGARHDLSYIELALTLHGELDEKQRQRLYEISKKCPVHKLLGKAIEIRTTVG